jgi:methylisocitrate lyase
VDEANQSKTCPPDLAFELRAMIARKETIVAPGVFNPILALLAKRAHFRCLYFSGGAFAQSLAFPDLGVTTLTEVADMVRRITSTVDLPIVVDIDTGFGEAANVARTIREMEFARAAAVHIEDQVMPKRCGHLSGKQLVETEEMVKKIISAKEARTGNLILIARTDARAVGGLDSAIDRAQVYLRAGADMVFPDALESESEFREFAKKVNAPLLANMTEFGKSPLIDASTLGSMGYNIVIFPATALRIMLRAVQRAFKELQTTNTQKGFVDKIFTREETYELTSYYSYERMDQLAFQKAREITETRKQKSRRPVRAD